jgi:hypothetical protein
MSSEISERSFEETIADTLVYKSGDTVLIS